MQNDVNDVLVEEGRQFGTPREFEDLVGLRLGALDFLHLLGRSSFRFLGRRRWLALQRNDFRDVEARCLHDILQMARAQPAHGLAETAEGRGRNAGAARQPVAEHDIIASSGADAVGWQQPRDLLNVERILERRIRIDIACCLQRKSKGERLSLGVG